MIKRRMGEYVSDYVFKHTRLVGITDKHWNSFYAFFYLDIDSDDFLTEDDKQKIVNAVNEKSDYHDFKEIYIMRPNRYDPNSGVIYEDANINDIINNLVEAANKRYFDDRKKTHEIVIDRIANQLRDYVKFKDDPFGHIRHYQLVDILMKHYGNNFLTNFDKVDYDKLKSSIFNEVKSKVDENNRLHNEQIKKEKRDKAWDNFIENKEYELGVKHASIDYFLSDEWQNKLENFREEFNRTYKD